VLGVTEGRTDCLVFQGVVDVEGNVEGGCGGGERRLASRRDLCGENP